MADYYDDDDEFDDLEEEDIADVPNFEEPVFEEYVESDSLGLNQMRQLIGSERRGRPFLDIASKAKLLAVRSGQLEKNYPPKIPRSKLKSTDSVEIAKQELTERVIPLQILKKYPDNTYELWPITDFKYIIGE